MGLVVNGILIVHHETNSVHHSFFHFLSHSKTFEKIINPIQMELAIQNVSKKYKKNKYGLKDFSLTIEKGILGLLGPNGAGKST